MRQGMERFTLHMRQFVMRVPLGAGVGIVLIIALLFSGCGENELNTNGQNTQIEYIASTCEVANLQGTINSTLKVGTKLYAGVYTKGIAVEDGRYSVVVYDTYDGTSDRIILKGKSEMAML